MPSGMCRTPGAYETVKRPCDGLEDCDLFASNGVFGDACPDANKYLDVNYDCVNNPGKLMGSQFLVKGMCHWLVRIFTIGLTITIAFSIEVLEWSRIVFGVLGVRKF